MIFSPSEVLPIAASTGFRAEMIEKVLHLLNLLDQLNRHPMLKGKWVLKGGTALNLFVFDLPRLSVDIDLNYVGALEREAMLADRPKVEQAAQAVFSREGFTTKRVPDRTCRREVALELPELQRANRQSRSGSEFHVQTAAMGYSDRRFPCARRFPGQEYRISPTCMSWRPANSLRCWHAVRQGICSTVTEFSR